ncbi:MAG TPA: Rieske 2Fe-2S domain-containing protein [Streptosporangiaceae bacterium]|nr:Rieske 2Fe-2S domain-containing protein [Streptosporangiaceae bacterium]
MRITFLGHAGFLVETDAAILVADPWLSPSGAFDASWFQFPRNHQLAALVQEKLADGSKARYLYVSHEHKDHFDKAFLDSIQCRDFTVILPHFQRKALAEIMAGYQCQDLVLASDQAEVPISGGTLKLYLDDSELNRDSAMLLKADGQSFLNLNDCRITDALPVIRREEGAIDVLAMQFSGANWHPVCYDYPADRYEAISRKKVRAKFHGVAQAVKTISPTFYLPSAGPPCFLDPGLLDINFQPANIFPAAWSLTEFLDGRFPAAATAWPELMPGDVLDVSAGTVLAEGTERVDEAGYRGYVEAYAAEYAPFFRARQQRYGTWDPGDLLQRLAEDLRGKLAALDLHDRILTNLYFGFTDAPGAMLRVNFPDRDVSVCRDVGESSFYRIQAPSWEVARVLDDRISWEDFAHTFRMRLSREPDLYQTAISAFLRLDAEDLNRFCAKILSIESRQERIIKEAGGSRYAVDRYCPHQGGDLLYGWVDEDRFLTCPRHGWRFDLEKGGACPDSVGSVHAACLEED